MLDLKNKKVLVTGATDGLGKHLALSLVSLGASVIIHGRNQEKIDQTIVELQAIKPGDYNSVLCNFQNPEEITQKLSLISELDILINNAGVWMEGNTIEMTESRIIELTHVNLLAPMLIARAVLPSLLKSEFGQILNISSIAGVEIPQGYYHTVYSGVKFGMQGFTEGLAKEFFNKNIRIMGYYPGGMSTNFFKKAGLPYEDKEPWMFDPQESVDAMIFMLTRNKKVNVKRMDLINQLEE